jgi:predicted Zn-dependent protease
MQIADKYGQAIALIAADKGAEAVKILGPLAAEHENAILIQIALGQAQMAAGFQSDGLSTFETAIALFPRNVPLTIRYAEALISTGRAKQAHQILLDLFNNVPPTPDQIRLVALAASSAGETGDAYFYMGEYQIATGSLGLAVQQLELALAAPNLTTVQRERYRARLDEIREFLMDDRAMRKVSNSRG